MNEKDLTYDNLVKYLISIVGDHERQWSYVHWVNDDKDLHGEESYCGDCCNGVIKDLVSSNPDGHDDPEEAYQMMASSYHEADHFMSCNKCGEPLNIVPTDHCIMSELEHYVEDEVPSEISPREAYIMLEVIEYQTNDPNVAAMQAAVIAKFLAAINNVTIPDRPRDRRAIRL